MLANRRRFSSRHLLAGQSAGFSVSFQELGKTWEDVQSEDDRELVDSEDE